MFIIKGMIYENQDYLKYEFENGHGQVSGSEMAMLRFQTSLSLKTSVGIPGYYVERDIDDPFSAYSMILECFDTIEKCEGEIPHIGTVPDGAIE